MMILLLITLSWRNSRNCGRVVIPTNIANDFKITPQQLEDAITPNTKMII
jgi:aspartate/methionine/tyrosine aminotransferase